MHIGIFTELYPPHVGGHETRLAHLAGALARAGHRVEVFCIGHERGIAADEHMDGVVVHRHPIVTSYRNSVIPGLPRSAGTVLRYALWCRRVLRARQFDLHIFGQWPVGHVLLAPGHARRRAIVDWCEVRGGPVYGRFERWLPRHAALNMAVSPTVARGIEAASGRHTFPLLSGVHLGDYRRAPDAERGGILYLGRLFPHKRVPMLVEAFAILCAGGYGGRLAVAGGGPARDDVQAARDRLPAGVRDRVDLLGVVDEATKVSLLARAEVLVLPSQREGFPLVVAEAMASGLPVVTTSDIGNGTRDIVAEYGLGAVAEPDPASLADAIAGVLRDWQRFAAAAASSAPALDWDQLVADLERAAAEHLGRA